MIIFQNQRIKTSPDHCMPAKHHLSTLSVCLFWGTRVSTWNAAFQDICLSIYVCADDRREWWACQWIDSLCSETNKQWTKLNTCTQTELESKHLLGELWHGKKQGGGCYLHNTHTQPTTCTHTHTHTHTHLHHFCSLDTHAVCSQLTLDPCPMASYRPADWPLISKAGMRKQF